MPYERKCKNWIATYNDWIYDRSQLMTKLIDWSAIWTLNMALRRKVALTKQSAFLGSWDCYPFTYLMAIGPSGVGKTTAIKYSFDLLDQVPALAKPPTFATVEGLIDAIIKSDDASTNLVVEEFGDLMMKDHSGKIYQFLTSVYDGKANIRQRTLSRDMEFADKPCVNMFAGTTPEWLADNISANTLNGGFGSRCIWLHVPGLRRRRMFYEKEMKERNYGAIEKDLVADLNHIAKNIEGEFTIEKEGRDWMEDWNSKLESKIKYKKIAGYIMRKPVFVLKVAIAFHVAYSDTPELSLGDLQNAEKMVTALEDDLPKIFEGIGKNEYSLEMKEILNEIKDHPGIAESELREMFKSAAGPAKLSELIDGLLLADLAKSEIGEENRRIFFAVEMKNGKK